MDIINLIITLYQEAPITAKIAYVAGIGTSIICLTKIVVKSISVIHTWITEK